MTQDGKIRVALFGLSANPPHLGHQKMVKVLLTDFDFVVVKVAGIEHLNEKNCQHQIDDIHRIKMTYLTFGSLGSNVVLDVMDLLYGIYTRAVDLDKLYKSNSSISDIVHVIGTDLLVPRDYNNDGKPLCEIEALWKNGNYLMRNANFVVFGRPSVQGSYVFPENVLYHYPYVGDISSSWIRELVSKNEGIGNLVTDDVREYIFKNNLYR